MRSTIRETHIISRRKRIIVGLLIVGLTLAGIVAFTNWFSFLMLLFLGVPGLLALLDTLTDDAE